MNNSCRLIAACAMLIAALTLLIPLGEIEPGNNYADKSLADALPVLGVEESKNAIDWNNCPIKLSYSFDETNWTEIQFFYDGYPLISYTIHEDALDLSDKDKNDVIFMKAEPTDGYSTVSDESTILIENFEVSWWHTSSEGVTLNYTEFVELGNNIWLWKVPISTLGECGHYDYLSIGFSVDDTKCQCNLYNDLNAQRIIFLSLNSSQSIQSELDALVGTYVCDEQSIQIYKNGDVYVKRILGEISNGQTVTGKIRDMYYLLGENGIKETLITVGYTSNIYLSIDKNSDGAISLTAVDNYTYSSVNPDSENISKGSVFERKSTGISINGLEYPDIQTAIDCAGEGDTIELAAGEYRLDEFITINKNVILKGVIGNNIKNSSVITGFQGYTEDNPVNIRIAATAATLDSLWIDAGSSNIIFNGDNSKGIIGAIDLQNSNNAIVQNCRFIKPEEPSQSVAIYAGKGSHISNNYFEGWQKAIYSEVKSDTNSISLINNVFFNKPGVNGLYFVNLTSSSAILNGNIFDNGKISNSSKVLTITKNVFNNAILNLYHSSEIFENVFTSTPVENKSTNEILDISANYWGENGPTLDISKFKFDSWFTKYDNSTRTLGGLTFKDNVSKIFVDCANKSEGDGTESNPYQTISEALANVKYGQEIHVSAGKYYEEIVITSGLRNITLIGSNYANSAYDSSWNQNGTILTNGISIETRGTHEGPYPNIVDGLTIKGFDFQKKGFVVIGWWENGSISNITIENNRFTSIDNGSSSAIHFNTSVPMAVNNLTICDNYIQDVGIKNTESPSGIHIAAATGTIIIDNNFIINTNHGSIQILSQSSGTLEITNNHLENWDFDESNGGRAFKFTNIYLDEVLISGNALVQKENFNSEDLSDTYLKITNSKTYILASENYWDGKGPTTDEFPIHCDEGSIIEIHSWYTQYDPMTNELHGLKTDDIPGVLPDVPSVPSFPDLPIIPEVPTPDENGDVSIVIPKKDIDTIVDDAVSSGSGSVTITDVSDIENVSSVTISKEDLQNILDKIDAEDAISDAVIKLPKGSVTIGKDVLSSILETAEENSITIKVLDAKDALNEEQQKIVGDRPVYDITMLKGSERVTSFNGKTITVSIAYELKEHENPDNIVVYYVKDDGTIEKMDCVYRDGKVSFETNHLSYFAISYEEPAPVPQEPAANDSDNTIYYAIAAVVILIVIAAAAHLIIKKRQ